MSRLFFLFLSGFSLITCNLWAIEPANENQSITDDVLYREFCLKAANEYWTFRSFKRSKILISVMQHVTKQDGDQLTAIISQEYPHLLKKMGQFKKNDRLGKPKMYRYKGFGKVSPTNLRYIKIAGDIEKLFGNLDGLKVVEIGGGYGGQCKVLKDLFKIKKYTMVDLPETLALAKKHLQIQGINDVEFLAPEEFKQEEYDLVISNYAFSECNREIQDEYINKAIACSKHGYMICNNISHFEPASYSAAELGDLLKNKYGLTTQILTEAPKTHPLNYLFVWNKE